MLSLHLIAKPALAAALVAAAGAAHALAGTGSLAGWTVAGDAVSQGGQIRLTTSYLGPDGNEPLNLSGTSAAGIAVVEATAGVAAYALDLPEPEYATEGSAVRQSFAVAAGDRLTFTWSFSTAENFFQDRAFVAINGQVQTLATRGAPGLASNAFTFTFAQAGTATLALGVVDTGDVLGVSTLAVGNLVLTPVPEPVPLALWAAGLVAVGCVARRRRAG